jgi:SAM-dependent methyltransferase
MNNMAEAAAMHAKKSEAAAAPLCRSCEKPLDEIVVDLGMSPFANSYIAPEQAAKMEPFYPLRVYICGSCFLVQLQQFETREAIFSDYAYFSSYSTTWLEHARLYAGEMIARFGLTKDSRVIEAASNDGYLLQFFQRAGIPVLGIEPARNVAESANQKGIPTRAIFFDQASAAQLRREGISADLLAGNNVYAHVPNLHEFTEGIRIALKPRGVVTLEFPHLLQLIRHNQFDTIYHEHFSYFSLMAVESAFARHGLAVFDVEELNTHGGSLRIFGKHISDETKPIGDKVLALRRCEHDAGLDRLETYRSFRSRVCDIKCALVEFLIASRREGKIVAGYGAPAKGNTLLNYCGVGPELLPYTVDQSPHKQGKLLPGSRIPVYAPGKIDEARPDYVLILPWNLREEIAAQLSKIREWGGRFVVPIPALEIF